MVLREIMSEFKFACPVCGQHMTADSRTSGTQLECPTCFQSIVVPQAPASGDSKLLVSAAQVGKPRPVQSDALWQDAAPIPARRMSLFSFAVSVVLLGVVCGVAWMFREKLVELARLPGNSRTKANPKSHRPATVYPIPTNVLWTLNLSNALIPDATASGELHGSGFVCERATLQGGHLTLRQGTMWPPDLGVSVLLFAKQGEELSGKTVEVSPDRVPPLPKVILRWKDEQEQARTRNFTSGYALKMIFGEAVNARMTGKIFLSLPDDERSVVAGTFDAEIRKAPAPKPPPP
jgi:hypothetical protein